MKSPFSLRSLALHGFLGAALFITSSFALTAEELSTLRAKAESGNGMAQYNLGLLHATVGSDIADPVEAYVWLSLAADNGATGRALLLLNSQLSPEQITQGKQRLEQRRIELAEQKAAGSSPVSETPTAQASPVESPSNPVAAPTQEQVDEAPVSAPVQDSTAQAELRKMSTELAAIWKENDQLKSLADRTKADADQLRKERDELAAKAAPAGQEVARLQAALANQEGERDALRQKLAEVQKASQESVSNELANSRARLEAAERDLAEAKAAGADLQSAKQIIGSLNERIRSLTADNERMNAESGQVSVAKEQAAAAQRELQTVRADLARVQAQLTESSRNADSASALEKQLVEARSKLDSAQHAYEAQGQEIQKFEKALASVDSERASLAKQLAQLKAAPPPVDTALAERLASLTSEAENLRAAAARAEELERQMADQESQLKQAQVVAARTQQEREELAAQLAAAKDQPSGEVTRLATELKDARDRLTAAEQALARAKEDRERSRSAELAPLQQELARMTQELETARERVSAAENLAQAEREQLRQLATPKVAQATDDAGQMEFRLRSAQEALQAANTERAALAERLASLEGAAAVQPTEAGVPDETTQQQLAETQTKLDAALRTFQMQQEEIDRLQMSLANIDGEREQLSERLATATARIEEVTTQATANQEAASQLSGAREQLRQAQNQIASLSTENSQLRNRVALASPPPSSTLSSPTRPGTVTAQAIASRPAEPPAAEAVENPAPRTHTVASGDTLTRIARRYYGSSERWAEILAANPDVIRDANSLTVGTTLRIP